MKKTIISILVFILVLNFIPISVKADTAVTGSIASPVWTLEKSPYMIEGDVEVLEGARLTIEAGAVIRFMPNARLIIRGELIAIGEEDSRIVFTSKQLNPSRADWSGIVFTENADDATYNENLSYRSGSIIKYADIKYAESVKCEDSSPYFENNLFLNNNIGIDITGGNEGLARMAAVKNSFVDNNVGINIGRTNKNTYVSTPAGSVLTGDLVETSFITKNYFNGNNKGIEIVKGDNNVIFDNRILYNLVSGIDLHGGSDNNIIEKNTINNNNIGLEIEAENTAVRQNNIKYNTAYGVKVSDSTTVVNYNNFENTKSIYNGVGSFASDNNYWGVMHIDDVLAMTDSVGNVNIANYQPIRTTPVNTGELLPPSVNSLVSPTANPSVIISGIKSVDTAVYFNGTRVVDRSNWANWQVDAVLDVGVNDFNVWLEDKVGKKSVAVKISIERENALLLSVNDLPSSTDKEVIIISGVKDPDTKVVLNSNSIVSLNAATNWSYEASLSIGPNEFSFYAENEEGRKSEAVVASITRDDISRADVIAKEKAMVTSVNMALSEKLSGHILLQVEENGEGWYINPSDLKKYYLGRQSDAFGLMRKFGLGIKHSELTNYINGSFPSRLAGKIMLDVEENGEAYYVDPRDNKGHFLGKPADAFNLMRELGLGISNENIRQIAVGD